MNIPLYFQPLRVRLSILLILAFSIILTQIPLFNYLGYEFSVAMAISISILSGFLTIGMFRSRFPERGPSDKNSATVSLEDFTTFQKQNLFVHLLLLILPLIVTTINMLAVKNCSYVEGLGFYVLITLVTVLFCISLGGLCSVFFRRSRLSYFFIVPLIFAHVLWLGYFSPQIYAYNLILGYFPGFSYDEVLTITPTLVFFRVITLIAAAFCFLLSMLLIRESNVRNGFVAKLLNLAKHFVQGWDNQKTLFLSTTGFLVVMWMFRVDLGFESSRRAIERELDRVVRTDHFLIRYAEGSFTEDEIRWIAAEHEFRFHQVAQKLQISFNGTITSYIYPTEEVKRRFIGTGTTNIAKPWRREMHLNKDSWRNVLKHELVHVLAGEFGMPIIRAHYQIGLVEGLAMAVEWDFGNRTLHEYAASMEHFGSMPARLRSGGKDAAQLLSVTGFALQASTVSYVLSGSFCRFLIDRYGVIRFKELYKGKSFAEVYRKNVGSLIQEWKSFLQHIPVQNEWEPHVQFYFNRKSIFAKECARYVARLNERGTRELNRNNPTLAMDVFSTSLRESWNSDAFTGLVRSAYRTSRYDTVVSLMESQLQENFSSIANLLLLYGDAYWVKEDLLLAKKAYEDVLKLDLSDSFNEAAALRLVVLEHPELRENLQSFFVRFEPDSAKIVSIEQVLQKSGSPVLHLIKAQLVYRNRNYEEALRRLEQIRGEFDPPSLNLLREKLLGLCHFYMRNFQQARVHFWQAMNYTSNEASRLRLHDWIDRCEWMESRKKEK